MVGFGSVEFGRVKKFREIVKMEHRLVAAVFAEKGHILPEIHVLKMVGDKASVTPLDAFPEIVKNFLLGVVVHETSLARTRAFTKLWHRALLQEAAVRRGRRTLRRVVEVQCGFRVRLCGRRRGRR
jgi:hypothetical protein